MNLTISCEIVINAKNVEPNIIFHAINLENSTMPQESGKITTKIQDESVVTSIQGSMTLGRLIYTVDDILKNALLSENIVSEIED